MMRIGFDPDDPELRARRLGLTSMEERAQRAGGELEMSRSRQTRRRLRVPVADTIDVLVVDHHAVVRGGPAHLLELQQRIEVVGEAGAARRRARPSACAPTSS